MSNLLRRDVGRNESPELKKRNKALCIMGGGLKAMSGASAIITAALASKDHLPSGKMLDVDSKGMEDNHHIYDKAIQSLLSPFSIISSNSGGSWFTYAFLTSELFNNNVLRNMTLRYMASNDLPSEKEEFDKGGGEENPFYKSFLQKSLMNINKWIK